METSIYQQTEKILNQLPLEGLEELAHFLEFLSFKYQLARLLEPSAPEPISSIVPADSMTVHFRGFVQSPLTVAELSGAYELNMYELDLRDNDE